MQETESIFGEVIHSYTREQGLEDGVLVSAQEGDFAEVTAQHFGQDAGEVVMTAQLFALIDKVVNNKRHCNDFKGVWHDVLFMGRGAAVNAIKTGQISGFEVIITGCGRKRIQTAYVAFDGEALTYGMQGDF